MGFIKNLKDNFTKKSAEVKKSRKESAGFKRIVAKQSTQAARQAFAKESIKVAAERGAAKARQGSFVSRVRASVSKLAEQKARPTSKAKRKVVKYKPSKAKRKVVKYKPSKAKRKVVKYKSSKAKRKSSTLKRRKSPVKRRRKVSRRRPSGELSIRELV
jgi:hypothetical protein